MKTYEYDTVLHLIPEKGGAYVIFPWNIREEFGKGRVKVHATFNGTPYDGSIVNMVVLKTTKVNLPWLKPRASLTSASKEAEEK